MTDYSVITFCSAIIYTIYYYVTLHFTIRVAHFWACLSGIYAFNLQGGDVKGQRRPQQQDRVGESLRFPLKIWCFFSSGRVKYAGCNARQSWSASYRHNKAEHIRI